MKKAIVSLLLVASTISIAHAQRFPGPARETRDPSRELRECLFRSDSLRTENYRLNDQLNQCLSTRGDGGKSEQLERENADLRAQNSFLSNSNIDLRRQNDNLKIDIARSEDESRRRDDRDGRGGDFDLARSIKACSKINNPVHSQECAGLAKFYSIRANVIEQCSKIATPYYARECVKSAGTKNASARQIEACLEIKNDTYVTQCVDLAVEKQLRAEVIHSCAITSTNPFFQLECVKSM